MSIFNSSKTERKSSTSKAKSDKTNPLFRNDAASDYTKSAYETTDYTDPAYSASDGSSNADEAAANTALTEKVDLLLKICSGARISSWMLFNAGISLIGSICLSTASKKLEEYIVNASEDELKAIASDEDRVRKISKLSNKSIRNACLDKLYKYVPNSNSPLLGDLINARFGVPIGSDRAILPSVKKFIQDSIPKDKKEETWTTDGLKHVYATYMLLPQADLDLIKAMFTYDTAGSGGAAWGSYGIYYVNYNKNNTDEKESWQHIEQNAAIEDTRKDLTLLDMTTAHELGHIVDAQAPGKPYSDRFDSNGNPEQGSFLAYSGWKRHPKSDPDKLINDIEKNITDPIPKNLTDEEAKVAPALIHTAAKWMITGIVPIRDIKDDAQRNQMLAALQSNALAQTFLDAGYQSTTNADGSFTFDAATMTTFQKLFDSNLLKHISRGFAEKSPWYNGELFPELPERQIHESYTWSQYWYSFSNKAWNDGKISRYQYRDPGEEFAEMYASYFVSGNGSKMPANLKKWFEAVGLNKSDRKNQPKGVEK